MATLNHQESDVKHGERMRWSPRHANVLSQIMAAWDRVKCIEFGSSDGKVMVFTNLPKIKIKINGRKFSFDNGTVSVNLGHDEFEVHEVITCVVLMIVAKMTEAANG